MQVMFDSKINKVTKIGDHDGTPRHWMITVYLTFQNGEKEKLPFKSQGKQYVRDLAELIDDYVKSRILIKGQDVVRNRWTAIAR